MDLAELDLSNDSGVASGMAGYVASLPCISWEATKQPPIILSTVSSMLHSEANPSRRRRRRRSSPLKNKKLVKSMSTIPEAPE